MTPEQKMIAEMAAQFMVEAIRHSGPLRDTAYATNFVRLARTIVKEASA